MIAIAWRLPSRSAKLFARARVLLATRTRRIVRTARIASRWVRACTPDPTIARSPASSFASRRVASPLTAAVRTAVIDVASIIARRRPRPASKSSTAPWWESMSVPSLRGKERHGLHAHGREPREVGGHEAEGAGLAREPVDLPDRHLGLPARQGGEGARHDVDAVLHRKEARDLVLIDDENFDDARSSSARTGIGIRNDETGAENMPSRGVTASGRSSGRRRRRRPPRPRGSPARGRRRRAPTPPASPPGARCSRPSGAGPG